MAHCYRPLFKFRPNLPILEGHFLPSSGKPPAKPLLDLVKREVVLRISRSSLPRIALKNMIKNLPPCSRNGRGRVRVKKSLKRPRVRSSRCVSKGKRFEEQMVQQYVPLVRATVARLAITLPPHVDAEDLYSAGLIGRHNAIRQYNPKKGTAFETYARVRIRGAIFDELRRMDWVPRSVHSKARRV